MLSLGYMKRVTIIGSPGSGKTTLSRIIAEKTGLPLIHLDRYFHDKSYGFNGHGDKKWISHVKKLTLRSEWIIEGNYRGTLESRLKRSDLIIFLDIPRYRSLYGLLKRRFEHRNKVREEMPIGWSEKLNYGLFKYVWNFKKKRRESLYDSIREFTQEPNKEVVILMSHNQAKEYIDLTF